MTQTETIIQQLSNDILSGKLQPGDRLPDERSLAVSFNVARGCIREALRALSLLGLVDIRPGTGTFVSQNDGSMPHEMILWNFHNELNNIEDLYDARRLIEGTVYLTCYDNKTPEIEGTIATYARELAALDPDTTSKEAFSDFIDQIDTYVGSACGNGIYAKLMDTMIVIRRDSALRILSIPDSRQSAMTRRINVLEAFHGDDREALGAALDRFFTGSVEDLTSFDQHEDAEADESSNEAN